MFCCHEPKKVYMNLYSYRKLLTLCKLGGQLEGKNFRAAVLRGCGRGELCEVQSRPEGGEMYGK